MQIGRKLRTIPSREPTAVLFAGNDMYAVLAAVRALRAAGHEPWLAVDRAGTYAGRSRATVGTVPVPHPAADREGFVRELARAAERLPVAAVLPCEETHLLALAGRENDFPGVAFGVPPRESVEKATNKGLLAGLAEAAGLMTPPTTLVRGGEGAVGVQELPAVVKPLRTWISRPDGTMSYHSVSYVTTAGTVREVLGGLPDREGLVQPYISGTNVSVSGVCWEGETVCTIHHVSDRIHPTNSGVTAYARTIAPNPGLEQGVCNLLRLVRWSGPFEMEFRCTPAREHYLIDLNPRIYGSLGLAVAAGLNLPAIWVDLLLGRRPIVGGYRAGTRFRQEENDVRALARMLMNGEFRGAIRGLAPRPGTAHAIFALHDPLPLLASAAKLARWRKGTAAPGGTQGQPAHR